MSLEINQYCVFAKIILLITQEITNVNNNATLLAKNNYLWFKAKDRLLDFSDFYHVDIFAYHRFKQASVRPQNSHNDIRQTRQAFRFQCGWPCYLEQSPS